MLRYKLDFARVKFAEVNEAFSTQTCSACNARSGPKGIAGLGIREWTCGECGTVHDRSVNAAKNILAAGRRRLAEGIHAIRAREDVKLNACRSISTRRWLTPYLDLDLYAPPTETVVDCNAD